MAKLYFRYGVMGSSKSAQALITKFNYEEQGMRVWLMKPAADTRYGADKVHSRIGLEQPADVIDDDMDLYEVFRDREREFYDVIIVDEAQFLQPMWSSYGRLWIITMCLCSALDCGQIFGQDCSPAVQGCLSWQIP